MRNRVIDDFGQVIFEENGLCQVLMEGGSIQNVTVWPCEALDQFNQICIDLDMRGKTLAVYQPLQGSVDAYHNQRAAEWFVPEEFQQLDVQQWLLDKCETDQQMIRVLEELILFDQRGLLPVLSALIYLVDQMRQRNILWGVGRGSSVASYCLYLIGVHRIDSLKYDLDIHEFLK